MFSLEFWHKTLLYSSHWNKYMIILLHLLSAEIRVMCHLDELFTFERLCSSPFQDLPKLYLIEEKTPFTLNSESQLETFMSDSNFKLSLWINLYIYQFHYLFHLSSPSFSHWHMDTLKYSSTEPESSSVQLCHCYLQKRQTLELHKKSKLFAIIPFI